MKNAFTLTEVLITLVVVGVIAAVTIPSVIVNTQKTQTEAELKKAYNGLVKVVSLSEIENGSFHNWNFELTSGDFIDQYMAPYLKVKTNVAYETAKRLKYKSLNGGTNFDNHVIFGSEADKKNTKVIYLVDGSIIFVDEDISNNKNSKAIYIDINGEDKPNVLGKDLFEFGFYQETGIRPNCFSDTIEENKINCYSSMDNKISHCCASVIIKNNWTIPNDYPW